jgi:hypothetical protein
MDYAVCSRLLGFDAGPQNETFYACEAHRSRLAAGDVSCFHALKDHPIEEMDTESEVECDFCREG